MEVSRAIGGLLEGILQPDTIYHFRLVATNEDGTTHGADVTFSTFSGFTGLPDGRGYEMVSPLANADGNVYTPGKQMLECGLCSAKPMLASADGDAVEYRADALATGGRGYAGGGGGGEEGEAFVATHLPGGGWSPVDLSTPGFDGAPLEASFSDELSNSGTSAVPAHSHNLVGGEQEGLFDSVGGRSVPVSVLPEGVFVTEAVFGATALPGEDQGPDYSNVISADGSRIFWTDRQTGPDYEHVYVREDDDRTVAVSVGAARFWTASVDSRYVFYTEGEKLWSFDVKNGAREELAAVGASVQGVVGVNETGEDGSYLYFVAQGVLASGAKLGGDNLYLRHEGVTTFIATLSTEDDELGYGAEGDWLADLGARTAEVASDGRSLVFLSRARLTGYDNAGCVSGPQAACREVFVYSADTGRLSCASCEPTGAPPTSGATLPRSQSDTFMHRWISKDGTRVFFESEEALVAQDTNGKTDVYEWEQEGAGSCQVRSPARQDGGCVYLLSGGTSTAGSYLLDASASGNDVFIISRAQLVPQDQGDTYELYDARVGAVQALTEPACTGTGCQGLPSAPPPFATPSSVTFNGVGNFSPSLAPVPVNPKAKAKPVKCKKGVRHECKKKPKTKHKSARKAARRKSRRS